MRKILFFLLLSTGAYAQVPDSQLNTDNTNLIKNQVPNSLRSWQMFDEIIKSKINVLSGGGGGGWAVTGTTNLTGNVTIQGGGLYSIIFGALGQNPVSVTLNADGAVSLIGNSSAGSHPSITVGGGNPIEIFDASNNGMLLDGVGGVQLIGDVTFNGAALTPHRGGTGLSALGSALQQLRVNSGGTALEYFTATALPTLTPGHIWVGDASSITQSLALSGDGSLSSAGVLSVTKLLGNTIPANAAGYLQNNGSGTLTWGTGTSTAWGTVTGTLSSQTDLQNSFYRRVYRTGHSYAGKAINIYGDSYTARVGATLSGQSYTDILCNYYGATQGNFGISGSTMEFRTPTNWSVGATSMVEASRLATIPTNSDALGLVIFAFGLNDMGYNGGQYNTTNFITDYTTVLNNAITTKGIPASKILLISPFYLTSAGYTAYTGLNGTVPDATRSRAFAAAVRTVAETFGTMFLDIYPDQSANDISGANFAGDNIHPNNTGHAFIAQAIIQFLGNSPADNLYLSRTVTGTTVPAGAFVQNYSPSGFTQMGARNSGGNGSYFQAIGSSVSIGGLYTGNQGGVIHDAGLASVFDRYDGTGDRIWSNGGFATTNEVFRIKNKGVASFTQAVMTSGWAPAMTVNFGAHTGMTASTEFSNLIIPAVSQQWSTGSFSTERSVWIKAPTLTFVGASTVTNAYNFYVESPVAGTNAIITNNYAVGVNGNLNVIGNLAINGSIGTNGQVLGNSSGTIGWVTLGAGAGSVTTVSVVSANGFAGTVATATSTPAITISTSVTGITKGNGTTLSAAIAGTDYQGPITLTAIGTSGAATLISNTLNIPQYSGGGGYATIDAAGTPLTQRTVIDVYNGLLAADNTTKTDITLGGALTKTTSFTGVFPFQLNNATPGQFTIGSTWTATADLQAPFIHTGTLTGDATSGHNLLAQYNGGLTFLAGGSNQNLIGNGQFASYNANGQTGGRIYGFIYSPAAVTGSFVNEVAFASTRGKVGIGKIDPVYDIHLEKSSAGGIVDIMSSNSSNTGYSAVSALNSSSDIARLVLSPSGVSSSGVSNPRQLSIWNGSGASGGILIRNDNSASDITFSNAGFASGNEVARFASAGTISFKLGLSGTGSRPLLASSTGVVTPVALTSNGDVLTIVAGVPAFAAPPGGGSVSLTAGNAFTGIQTFTGSPVTVSNGLFTSSITDAATNAYVIPMTVQHLSSSTAAAGFGVSMTNSLQNASGSSIYASRLNAEWTTATAGSESSKVSHQYLNASSQVYAYSAEAGNFAFFANSGTYGSGVGVLYIPRATTHPTGTISTGGDLYVNNTNDHLIYRTATTNYDLTAGGGGSGTVTSVTLTQPAAGLTLTNSGSSQTTAVTSTFALANDLSALEGLSSTGIAVRTATDTWAQRTITGTANQIIATNGDGVSGNPTLALSSTLILPSGTTATTPTLGDNSTSPSTTAFVVAAIAAASLTAGTAPTDANYTAVTNSYIHIVSGTSTASRNFVVPTGSNGDMMIVKNNDAGFAWTPTTNSIYFSDNTTTLTSFLANTVYCLMKIDGRWTITN